MAPRLLMCPPDFFGIEYEINPWMHLKHHTDLPQARRQWGMLYATVRDLGATVELLEPIPGLPDLVFTANAGLVYGSRFLGSRFKFGVRRGESPHFEHWFATHGFHVEALPEGVYFEGAGDALFCGDSLFAGYRFRSDARGHQCLAEKLGVEVLPLELVDPRFYHLDTCFCPLAEGEAIYYPGAFDGYGRAVLNSRVGRLIEVDEVEAASFACNAVVLGRTVVLNEGACRLSRELERAGYAVRSLSLSEFLASGGSAKCLTFRIDGEEAASWKHRPRRGAA